MSQTRRDFLRTGSAVLAASLIPASRLLGAMPEKLKRPARPIGFSLYGMKSLPVLDALDHCARIGYNNVELCVMKDFPTELSIFTPELRRAVKTRLDTTGLEASSLLIQGLLSRADKQAEMIETIKSCGQLAHDLNDKKPPLVETVMGGKAEEWEQIKDVLAERLYAWGEAAKAGGILLAVKAHYGHAVNSPDRLLWLYRKVNHPNIVLTYDYSHYQAEGFGLEESLRAVIPYTRFIHMKDVSPGKPPGFLLPGEGHTIDYVQYFRLLKETNYQGPILVEVSAHIHRLEGYQPIAAAEKSYANLSRARDAAWA